MILLQVLGLVAFIRAHKDLKARNLAESGSLPTSPVPVRRSRTFKECFTTAAVVYMGCSVVAAIIGANVTWETNKLRQLHALENLRLTKEMYKLRP